jgi:hypothetical protein
MARVTERNPVYLLGCVADVADADGYFVGRPPEVCLVGLFDMIEFCPYEPSAYVWSPYYLVAPRGVEGGRYYAVPAQDYVEQVYPDSHARELVQERMMEFREEDECKEV